MLKLNLLPFQEKKNLELTEFSRLLVFLGIWLSAFLIIFTLFLVSTFFCLSILLREQNNLIEIRQNDSQMQTLLKIEEKTKQTNKVIEQIYLKQQDLILWTPLLEEITKTVPSGIYLTNFSYRTDDNQITLNGRASHRDILLGLQKSLEESSFFEEVEAPLANLVKQRDIDFSFTLHPK